MTSTRPRDRLGRQLALTVELIGSAVQGAVIILVTSYVGKLVEVGVEALWDSPNEYPLDVRLLVRWLGVLGAVGALGAVGIDIVNIWRRQLREDDE